MRTRKNPRLGRHPDLFEGESNIHVSFEDLSPEERAAWVSEARFAALTDEERNALTDDERTQAIDNGVKYIEDHELRAGAFPSGDDLVAMMTSLEPPWDRLSKEERDATLEPSRAVVDAWVEEHVEWAREYNIDGDGASGYFDVLQEVLPSEARSWFTNRGRRYHKNDLDDYLDELAKEHSLDADQLWDLVEPVLTDDFYYTEETSHGYYGRSDAIVAEHVDSTSESIELGDNDEGIRRELKALAHAEKGTHDLSPDDVVSLVEGHQVSVDVGLDVVFSLVPDVDRIRERVEEIFADDPPPKARRKKRRL